MSEDALTPADERSADRAAAIAFGAYLSIPYISFRPITFAILILALTAWLLLRDRRIRANGRSALIAARGSVRLEALWLIPALTALLANIHLCVIVVPIWMGCLLLGAMWEHRDVARYAVLLV